jgi:hypothetical protein
VLFWRSLSAGLMLLLLGGVSAQAGRPDAQWVTHPEAGGRRPIVLQFRRDLRLDTVPATFMVLVSADNRFVLQVNGRRVGAGPATSDLAHWRYERLDLAPYLKRGANVVSATVWNFVMPEQPLAAGLSDNERMVAEYRALLEQTGRAAQISAATGFWLRAEDPAGAGLDSGPAWQVAIDRGRSASGGMKQFQGSFYVAGAPEAIDAGPSRTLDWVTATPALSPGAPVPWTLSPDPLPAMLYRPADPGRTVRASLRAADRFPAAPVTVPAHTRTHILLQRDAMISGYPELAVSGGRGATILATYAEALVDEAGKKGVRDEVAGRKASGLIDTFRADGGKARFAPLWWRTWRYLELDIATFDEPLTLEGLAVFETGYPFEATGRFRSSDPQLDAIWEIGWRTARIDAHDTYMDSSFYEQLQYVGDTRLQMLITYAVSGDPRLPVQALDAFGWSRVDGGLTEGAYPSRRSNIIPTFSLLWIGMLHDYWWQQPDTAVLTRNLPRAREVLDWYAAYQQPSGLLKRTPHWSFVDWVGQPAADREVFPSYDAAGESCLTTLHYLGALRQAAELEEAVGDAARAPALRQRADRAGDGIRARCWDAGRRLFADSPAKDRFSQHANILAALYDVVPREEGAALLARVLSGHGIDAPAGLATSSYYFAWYLVRALEHVGRADRYPDLLATWRDLLTLHFTTWPEQRGDSRSDSHAWSAHPTADLLGIVAGIQPGAPGYASIRVEPHLGGLEWLDATAQTPKGPVSVSYRIKDGMLTAEIAAPAGASGQFLWKGIGYPLAPGANRFTLPR